MSQKYLCSLWQSFSKFCINCVFIQSNKWFCSKIAKILEQKKFRNQTGTRASKGFPYSGSSVYFGCFAQRQKETPTLITQSKNDYIIALKRNQKKLCQEVVKISENQSPKSQTRSVDISHGRQVVRKVSVFDVDTLNTTKFDYSKCNTLGIRHSWRQNPVKNRYGEGACLPEGLMLRPKLSSDKKTLTQAY